MTASIEQIASRRRHPPTTARTPLPNRRPAARSTLRVPAAHQGAPKRGRRLTTSSRPGSDPPRAAESDNPCGWRAGRSQSSRSSPARRQSGCQGYGGIPRCHTGAALAATQRLHIGPRTVDSDLSCGPSRRSALRRNVVRRKVRAGCRALSRRDGRMPEGRMWKASATRLALDRPRAKVEVARRGDAVMRRMRGVGDETPGAKLMATHVRGLDTHRPWRRARTRCRARARYRLLAGPLWSA